MNYFESWTQAFSASFQNAWFRLAAFLPQLLAAVLLLILGWIIATALSRLVRALLVRSRVDHWLDRTGTTSMLGKDAKFKISDGIAWLVKWFVLLVTLVSVSDSLGLPQITQFLNSIALYIPNVIVAIAILAIGVAGATLIRSVVERALAAAGYPGLASTLGGLAKWSIVIFAFMAALVQLGVAASLVNTAFAGLIGMLALAGGLAFGLGGREKAARWLERLERSTDLRRTP